MGSSGEKSKDGLFGGGGIVNYELRIVNYELRIVNYELSIMN